MDEEYNDDVTQEDLDSLIDRANTAEVKNVQLSQALSSIGGERRDGNFLHHQISTVEMLKNLEHFYRGDYQSPNEDNQLVWKTQQNKDLVTLNDFGVALLMEVVSKYIDKNTILSYYPEERIYEILADIGDELILVILCNYEKMGMNTYSKKTKFRLIVTTTLHIIESTYRRSLRGKTMEEINQSRVVGQFGNPNQPSTTLRKPNILSRFLPGGNR